MRAPEAGAGVEAGRVVGVEVRRAVGAGVVAVGVAGASLRLGVAAGERAGSGDGVQDASAAGVAEEAGEGIAVVWPELPPHAAAAAPTSTTTTTSANRIPTETAYRRTRSAVSRTQVATHRAQRPNFAARLGVQPTAEAFGLQVERGKDATEVRRSEARPRRRI